MFFIWKLQKPLVFDGFQWFEPWMGLARPRPSCDGLAWLGVHSPGQAQARPRQFELAFIANVRHKLNQQTSQCKHWVGTLTKLSMGAKLNRPWPCYAQLNSRLMCHEESNLGPTGGVTFSFYPVDQTVFFFMLLSEDKSAFLQTKCL